MLLLCAFSFSSRSLNAASFFFAKLFLVNWSAWCICCEHRKFKSVIVIVVILEFDDLWPLEVNWGYIFSYHSKVHTPWYTTSYLTSIHTISLEVPFLRYFTSNFTGINLLPLIFRSYIIWKPVLNFLSNSFWHFLSVFEIFDFKLFRPLEEIWGNNFLTIRKLIHDFIDVFYLLFPLYRTIFEIFDFKHFKVWPWRLIFRGHMMSKMFTSFENPSMTSYLTSIDTFAPSRTLHEIFYFKYCWVWPWPFTSKGHLRTNNFIPFESPYMWLPIRLLWTPSPHFVPFSRKCRSTFWMSHGMAVYGLFKSEGQGH